MKIKTTPPPIRALSLFFVLALVFAQGAALIPFKTAKADQITVRSLTLQTSDAGVGGSTPGGVVDHLFTFTLPNVGSVNVGSISFEYCTTPADVGALTCQSPEGMQILADSGASLALGSLTGISGYTLSTVSNNSFLLNRGSAASIAAGTPVTALIKNITNPQDTTTPDDNYTFFVRIKSFASTDGSGSPIDTGSVAASTADTVVVTGTMPESLVFCTGATIGLDVATSTTPDCSTATTADINFDKLFSPTDTAAATSQMAATTNAGFGYSITVAGPTLTSGSNTITAMGTPTGTAPGTSQFGMNLVKNSTASAELFNVDDLINPSKDPAPVANGTNFRGVPATDYATADLFKFNPAGESVANSGNAATDMQIFTVSYIVNVPGSQPAGDYVSTLTYVCTPLF